MKILIFSDLWVPFPGGAERYVSNIAYEMQKHGHELSVLTSYEKAKDDKLPVDYISIGVGENHGHGAEILRERLRTVKPDLILTHHFFAYEFEKELVHSGIPVVQIIHNSHRLERAALAVYNSKWTWDHSNPHDDDKIIHPPAYQTVNANRQGDYIGFVKPVPGKGIHFLYKLAALMPQRQFLVLKGEWWTVEVIEQAPNITFMDPVADIRDFYGQCWVMLMPSLSEDAGTIPQEAAINGMPCISSDVMGLQETNQFGIRLPLDEMLWKWQIEFLGTNREYYKDIARRQRQGLAVFDWDDKFMHLSNHLKALVP